MSGRLDPQGKRALFEAPVTASRREVLRPGPHTDGRDALFSAGPARAGTVRVECGRCDERTRVALAELTMRLLGGSVWLPGRRRSHWMRCPACGSRAWCRIGWRD